jgi:ABC-type lipoprotein export system ATPase subunit
VAETLKSYARANAACVICVSHDRTVIDAADDLLTLERP